MVNNHASYFDTPIHAGFPSPADDFLEKKLDLNEYLVKNPAATFFIRVRGHSMIGAGILDGDMLVVDRSLEARNDSIIVAVIDGEFTVKRLKKEGKNISLVAENRHYKPIKIKEEMEFEVWGVVTGVIQDLRFKNKVKSFLS